AFAASSSAKKRGGRQSCLTLFPGIDQAFLQIVDPHTAGDPDQDGVLWTNLSRPKIAEELLRRGFRVSVTVVSQLLERHRLGSWSESRRPCRCSRAAWNGGSSNTSVTAR